MRDWSGTGRAAGGRRRNAGVADTVFEHAHSHSNTQREDMISGRGDCALTMNTLSNVFAMYV